MNDRTVSAFVAAMNERTRRCWAAWARAVAFSPDEEARFPVIANDSKARFLRALKFVALTEAEPPRACVAAGIPRGTVAGWLHRDARFRQEVEQQLGMAAAELAAATGGSRSRVHPSARNKTRHSIGSSSFLS
jgi:hypothetical protein